MRGHNYYPVYQCHAKKQNILFCLCKYFLLYNKAACTIYINLLFRRLKYLNFIYEMVMRLVLIQLREVITEIDQAGLSKIENFVLVNCNRISNEACIYIRWQVATGAVKKRANTACQLRGQLRADIRYQIQNGRLQRSNLV